MSRDDFDSGYTANDPRGFGEDRLIDPDCRDPFKHRSCAGGPCECPCHDGKIQ